MKQVAGFNDWFFPNFLQKYRTKIDIIDDGTKERIFQPIQQQQKRIFGLGLFAAE